MTSSGDIRKAARSVLERIEDAREDIADLCLRLGNTYGPFGEEATTADEVLSWYRSHGIEARSVPVTGNRANVVARLRGGRGPSVLFNAHLDTEASGTEFDNLMNSADPNRLGARREGDRIFGQTVLNDRGCMALFMIAARAIHDSGVSLGGDILLTSVAGETGAAPVDEYQGIRYEGKGFGSQFIVNHGVRADYALVAETTDFGLCWSNLGAAYFKITLRGQNMYTPRLVRPEGAGLSEHPNAIVKAAHVVTALEEWAIRFEAARSCAGPCGPVRPKAQVGAIRGGLPWRPNRSSPYCALYLDVRTLPGEDVTAVTRELAGVVEGIGVGASVELTMAKPGATATGHEPLAEAITEAHRQVRGDDPPAQVSTSVASMWRDTNIFNRAGIPAITFGPGRGPALAQGTGYFSLDDLVDAAKMYALAGLGIGREEVPVREQDLSAQRGY